MLSKYHSYRRRQVGCYMSARPLYCYSMVCCGTCLVCSLATLHKVGLLGPLEGRVTGILWTVPLMDLRSGVYRLGKGLTGSVTFAWAELTRIVMGRVRLRRSSHEVEDVRVNGRWLDLLQ